MVQIKFSQAIVFTVTLISVCSKAVSMATGLQYLRSRVVFRNFMTKHWLKSNDKTKSTCVFCNLSVHNQDPCKRNTCLFQPAPTSNYNQSSAKQKNMTLLYHVYHVEIQLLNLLCQISMEEDSLSNLGGIIHLFDIKQLNEMLGGRMSWQVCQPYG